MGRSTPRRTVFLHEYATGGGLAGSRVPASWLAEGSAMRRAVARDFQAVPGLSVLMTLDTRLAREPGPWRTVPIGPDEEPSTFARLAAEADYTLCIAPETGGILLERARTIERVGGRSLGSSPEAIALCGDKLRLGQFLTAMGIATPTCHRVVSNGPWPEDFPYPAVLKPIDGAGSVETFLVERCDARRPVTFQSREAILQPFCEGVPMSVSFLNSQPVGFALQRMSIDGGRFAYRGGTVLFKSDAWDPDLRRLPRQVPGLFGFVGVDYLWNTASRRALVLEINPRVTTSYVGLARRFRPGTLATMWLKAVDSGSTFGLPWAEPRLLRRDPITFDADGTIHEGDTAP